MNIFYKKPFLIADIGVNYYDIAQKEEISNMEAAKLMILEAKKCGVDAVKFESYKTENIMIMMNLERKNFVNWLNSVMN